jgi:hypothetical protein
MHIVGIRDLGTNYRYQWPEGRPESYDYWVEYTALSEDGEHFVRIGFGKRHTYGRERARVVVWIDDYPHAEFLSADDFEKSGEVLSEIKVRGHRGERMCRYPDEPVPERYAMFNVVGLPVRVIAEGVHSAWAVVANIADQKAMVALASLRRYERAR